MTTSSRVSGGLRVSGGSHGTACGHPVILMDDEVGSDGSKTRLSVCV